MDFHWLFWRIFAVEKFNWLSTQKMRDTGQVSAGLLLARPSNQILKLALSLSLWVSVEWLETGSRRLERPILTISQPFTRWNYIRPSKIFFRFQTRSSSHGQLNACWSWFASPLWSMIYSLRLEMSCSSLFASLYMALNSHRPFSIPNILALMYRV